MKARLATLSPRALTALAIAGVLLYAAVVWFVLVAPKRSEASRLAEEIAAAEIRLVQAQAAANRPGQTGVPVSDLFRLAKAMPTSEDQSGLVLELSRVARGTGVVLRSITPQEPVAGVGGPTTIPVAVTVGGSYFAITRFLNRVQSLVTVRGGVLRATGRLLTVQRLELAESATDGFPALDAIVNLNAYVYDGPIVQATTPTQPAEELTPTGGTAIGSTS